MSKPVLAILAAGMGSRYGGLKQIDTVGNNGESIIDFSIYDAIEAGFETVVLIIRKEHEESFEEALGKKIRPFINVIYAYQNLEDIPEGFSVPEGREKPWGTTHALLSLKNYVTSPFAIINADDYYGKNAFKVIYNFLANDVKDHEYAMVGYVLENTITEHGTVSRAVCQPKGEFLAQIVERAKIGLVNQVLKYEESDGSWVDIQPDSLVSMNYWGFTPAVFDYFEDVFKRFLHRELDGNPMKCEHVIPTAVGEGLKEEKLSVRLLSSNDKWYGVTYKEDKPTVVAALANMKEAGDYPFDLWKQ